MKGTANNAFSYALLIMTISLFMSFETLSQDKSIESTNSKAEVLSKSPILEAELNSIEFQVGNSIELTLTVKNKSKFTVVLFDAVPERSFEITVKDENGMELEPTKEGRKKMFPDTIMARESIFLKSGKELKLRKKVRLDELFDFERTGTYTLEVKRSYYFEENADLKNEDMVLISIVKFEVK